jgi:hypothetical protein
MALIDEIQFTLYSLVFFSNGAIHEMRLCSPNKIPGRIRQVDF